jgi:hypothetical protein
LDEALSLAIGPMRIWLGEDLAQTEAHAGCHHALDANIQLAVKGNGSRTCVRMKATSILLSPLASERRRSVRRARLEQDQHPARSRDP